MFRFLKQKIKNRKWLMMCLFLGNLLLISVLCCITMYSNAVQSRILERRMDAMMEESGEYPMKLDLNAVLTVVNSKRHTGEAYKKLYDAAHNFEAESGVPLKELVETVMISSKADTELLRNGKKLTTSIQLAYMGDIENHCTIVDGTMYSTDKNEDGTYSVIVSEKFLATQKLTVGEVLKMKSLEESGEKIRVKIVGVFKTSEEGDEYWVQQPGYYDAVLFMPQAVFERLFVNYDAPKYSMRGSWSLLFNYEDLERKQIESLISVTKNLEGIVEQETSLNMWQHYEESLEVFLTEDNQTAKTLWILQAPILVLLLTFIMMVSKQTLLLEQGEIAVLKSRGAGRGQIILLYFLQSILLGLVACVPGVAIGALLCQLLGSANAFLEFVGRNALHIQIFKPMILADCFGAVFVSTVATVFPVIKYSNTSTVSQKQKRRKRRSGMPVWQKFGLDFIILAIGIYGWYSFRGQEEALTDRVLKGESINMLLYFSSALFMVGVGLVVTRIIHLIPKLVCLVGKKFFGPAAFASFTRITRSESEQNFIIVFLILTISLGIFNADTARTINANDENNVNFLAGADIVLKEEWDDNSAILMADSTGSISFGYTEPEISRFSELDGVESVAKVYEDYVDLSYGKYNYSLSLMAIDTKEFGNTAIMPDGLTETHWYNYLNAMAEFPNGVLLSSSFREYAGIEVGDTIHYSLGASQFSGRVCGFVDYFPGMNPKDTFTDWNGKLITYNRLFIISNLSYIQTVLGVKPYEVWIKTNGSTDSIYSFLEDNNIRVPLFRDATATIADHKNDALLQGTNGMLTVGFLIVLALCIIGFLIFWILSIKQRTLQFGVFRAMGMTMKEIVQMLVTEQFFVTGFAVAAGVGTGIVSSKLFIPLIQIAYTRADNVLPLQIISLPSDTVRILVTVGVMIIACIIALGVFISRTGIAQALKLGEDS